MGTGSCLGVAGGIAVVSSSLLDIASNSSLVMSPREVVDPRDGISSSGGKSVLRPSSSTPGNVMRSSRRGGIVTCVCRGVLLVCGGGVSGGVTVVVD